MLKLENKTYLNENNIGTEKIVNEKVEEIKNSTPDDPDESNIFLNYDPSISSTNSQAQSTSTRNIL